jgi:hypothetical protein
VLLLWLLSRLYCYHYCQLIDCIVVNSLSQHYDCVIYPRLALMGLGWLPRPDYINFLSLLPSLLPSSSIYTIAILALRLCLPAACCQLLFIIITSTTTTTMPAGFSVRGLIMATLVLVLAVLLAKGLHLDNLAGYLDHLSTIIKKAVTIL